ncbi:MAG: ABC transporter permease [Candidatus Rokubacteria bacterium]|nr:ABC transporter permease [Candidatus Rokubacteria bacterium]
MDEDRPRPGGGRAGWRRRLLRHREALAGALLSLLVVVSALAAGALAPRDPLAQEVVARLQAPGWSDGEGWTAWLGTDQLGRDILSRLVYGGRVSLLVSVTSVAGSLGLGLALGLVAGFYSGPVEALIMRLTDLQLAFPFILLALAIVALLGPSLPNIIVVFTVTSWPIYARVVRGSVLGLKPLDFVTAARALGRREPGILLRHIAPNTLAPLTVIAFFEMARMIITEAALGFLGLGVQPPTATWGNMLADGRDYIRDAWWLSAFPGLAIMLTAAGVNLLGDGLRDLLDPRQRAG